MAAKEAEIRKWTNNLTVAKHINELAKDKFNQLQAIKDAATNARALASA